jgi:hypothetical protein
MLSRRSKVSKTRALSTVKKFGAKKVGDKDGNKLLECEPLFKKKNA